MEFHWDGWAEDDDGNTAEFQGNAAGDNLRGYSVTDASTADILDFAGYVPGPGMSVQKDFDGRAYVYFFGAQVAVVCSEETCASPDCVSPPFDGPGAQLGFCASCSGVDF